MTPAAAPFSMPPESIVTLRYRVPDERREALLTFLSETIPLYESPGGIAVHLFESIDERGLFLELVTYRSRADFDADQLRVESHPDWTSALARWHAIVGGSVDVDRMERAVLETRRAAKMETPAIVPATEEMIERVWTERWGIPVVTPFGIYRPSDVRGIALEGEDGAPAGLVTWSAKGNEAEIVTVDTLEGARGEGPRLLRESEARLRSAGVRLVKLVTSNDNVRACGFYQACGYRLSRLHLDAVENVRRTKPGVPEFGLGGLPLRDLWEFEKRL